MRDTHLADNTDGKVTIVWKKSIVSEKVHRLDPPVHTHRRQIVHTHIYTTHSTVCLRSRFLWQC